MVTFDYKKSPITQIADYIIMYSAKSGASDIHFDPHEDGLMVRIRVDGDLQDYTLVPQEYERNLTTRLKLLANMNITESRLPQDGSIKGKFGNLYLDMRVSSLPTNQGEKIVIRILDYSRSLEGLESLGFSHKNFEKLKRMIAVPNGILLVTGATGSGKSTTTYSILQALNKKEVNIITVEDPVEMNIEGLNQVQVNSEIGLDFATVLRSILRQDPNIILIGEIRDSETAKIAVRASITGHFVLSTIHTNNSLATIERLLDMDVERYLLSSALTGIISQRLAKRVCPKCRVLRETTDYEKKVFKMALGKEIDKLYDANHEGCSECHNGYRDRIAVQEVLEIDDDIRLALNNEKITKEEMRSMVYTSNVTTLLQDGLNKVLEGITTFEEIYRIIEIDIDDDDTYTNVEEQNEEQNEEQIENENTEVQENTNNKQEDNDKTESGDEKQENELNKEETEDETNIDDNNNKEEENQSNDDSKQEPTEEESNKANDTDDDIPSIDDILANIDNNQINEKPEQEAEEEKENSNPSIEDILASVEEDKEDNNKTEETQPTLEEVPQENKSFESLMPNIEGADEDSEPTLEEVNEEDDSIIPNIEGASDDSKPTLEEENNDSDNNSIIPNIEGASDDSEPTLEEESNDDSDNSIIPNINNDTETSEVSADEVYSNSQLSKENDDDNESNEEDEVEPTLVELPTIDVEIDKEKDEKTEKTGEDNVTSSDIYENPNLAGLERL